jgi:class 3 adenylate cyclase/pimeloyl-ACP methyl ester carboxylesterase
VEPRIQYAKTKDGVNIAFCVMGDGPPLVLVPSPPLTHAQLQWEVGFPSVHQSLAHDFRLVWYDSRGSGLSDRDAIDFSMDAMIRDIEAVVARLGLETFVLCSIFDGVPLAVTYAATHPERVSHLILLDGWTKWSDYLKSPAYQVEAALREQDWVLYTETFARVLMGIDDPPFARQLSEHIRACVEPDALREAFAAMEDYDVSALLPSVAAPTLVVHNKNNRFLPVQSGQQLAARITDSRFLIVDDIIHQRTPTLVAEFVGATIADTDPLTAGTVHTILFTDVEGSTALTDRLGDAKARELLREHERIVREALKTHGGSEVKALGDGFMTSFSSATKALECAIAMQRAFAEHNEWAEEPILVRIGLNAGEPIAEDDDLYGTAVNEAARISATAKGGEILASDVVRQLVKGKDFLFADRGEVSLKGFEDPVRLYEVSWREEKRLTD